MRVIDADEAIINFGFEWDDIPPTREEFVYFLKKQPTIDAVPVVRCRDCKHAWIHPCGYVYCHRDGRNAYEMTFNLDSFCSYGELKEGAD